jgi:hypothetical protein
LKSHAAANERFRLFSRYAGLRLRLFLREILQLHQRFLIAFLYVFGLILSGNEQIALRQNLAHLLSPLRWTISDLVCLACLMLYGWIVAGVARWSARGGRVQYLAESLPLPFVWERLIRALVLTVVNLTILIVLGLGLQQLIQEGGSWIIALLLSASYYLWILMMQLGLLEQNWRLFPFHWLGAGLLVLAKGTLMLWLLMGLSTGFALWIFCRQESRAHDHPELPLGTWQARWRSAITRRFPPQMMMQISYSLAKPALLLYCLFLAIGLQVLLAMVLKQEIPLSQKIHVYTSATGFFSLLLSSFFRNFYLQRREWQTWLESLPRSDSWWLQQDTWFVSLLYGLMIVPGSLFLVMSQYLPWLVPFLIVPLHMFGFIVLRFMQRSRHLENGIFMIIGLSVWFILLGYFCDHSLQWIMGFEWTSGFVSTATRAMSDL